MTLGPFYKLEFKSCLFLSHTSVNYDHNSTTEITPSYFRAIQLAAKWTGLTWEGLQAEKPWVTFPV